jgi:predicted Zn-dependent protease
MLVAFQALPAMVIRGADSARTDISRFRKVCELPVRSRRIAESIETVVSAFTIRRMPNNFLTPLALLLIVALASCGTSPTGRNQLLVFPADQLDAMGVQAFEDMRSQLTVETDPAINDYVRCVATAITDEVPDKRTNWEVVVFKDDNPNAFALPGGKMGVYTGMLGVAENQDQLASVLGHEVGHVLAQHGNERMSQQQLTNVALAAAAGSGYLDTASMQALGLGAQIGILLPYGRTHESEADIIGLDLMAEAGFDPRESVQLWKNMDNAGGGAPPEFLSTHPASSTRIDNLLSRMADALRDYNDARAKGKKPNCK